MASCRLFSALTALALSASVAHAQTATVEGERGLYVWERADSVHVQWITAMPRPSELRVWGDPDLRIQTREGVSHHATFPTPRSRDYAISFDDALRQTFIYGKTLPVTAERPHADSLFVFGDTHGEFDSVRLLLRNAGLIDDQSRWSGGRKQIVFLGDVVDRGAHVTPLLWFLYRLEREAHAAGGAVHLLLGNHEVMVMLGDLRYVHPAEQRIAKAHNVSYQQLFHPQQSVLGRWLASKPAVMKIGDLLLTHGGVSTDFIGETPESLAKTLTENIRDGIFVAHVDTTKKVRVDSTHLARWENFFWGERSLFWYRGYAQSDTLAEDLTRTLKGFKASAMVVGHTPQQTMATRYNGKLIIAHPRRPGSELLLITGRGDQRKLQRILAHGSPEIISP